MNKSTQRAQAAIAKEVIRLRHENIQLRNAHADLVAALSALVCTARTFRNVPKSEQEWTPIDDEALDAAFAALAKAKGEQ
jgi:hypothetical protein